MGLIRYAERAATTAEQEISLIGTGSIAVALILVLLPFRSLSPLLLTALTVATGVIAAFSASLAVFEQSAHDNSRFRSQFDWGWNRLQLPLLRSSELWTAELRP